MNLRVQRQLAAQILKCSPKRIRFDEEQVKDIQETITKADLRVLISNKAIRKVSETGVSRGRARHNATQKRKGRSSGPGSRKGKQGARLSKKQEWMNKTRKQRALLKQLKEKEILTTANYRQLFQKVKGGFFRSVRHLKLYATERNLMEKK